MMQYPGRRGELGLTLESNIYFWNSAESSMLFQSLPSAAECVSVDFGL
jgi:hypothetical protein